MIVQILCVYVKNSISFKFLNDSRFILYLHTYASKRFIKESSLKKFWEVE